MENNNIEEAKNKKYNYGDKYKGRYKEYHKQRYEEKKDEYKDNVKLRRVRIKKALIILEDKIGLKLKDL